MNKLLQILILATLGLISQQSRSQLAPILDNNRSEWVAQTVTAGARARVIITRTKSKLHLPKTQRPVIQLLALEDDDTNYYDELPDMQIGYRRPELINQSADVELSDEIKLRLLLARKRALDAYYAIWS